MPLPRTILIQVVLFAVFGLWLPWQKGVGFLDSIILSAYACLGVAFAAPMAASGISVLKAVRAGALISWALLVAGIAVVYLTRTVVVGPDLRTLAEAGLFGVSLSAATSSIISFALAKTSVGTAKLLARLMLLSLMGLFYLRSGWLPEVALTGAAVCAGVTALFWVLSRRVAA